MRHLLSALLFVAAFCALTVFPHASLAEAWPSKPIRLIVPHNTGASPDVIARLVAGQISGPLGQQVYVDNRGGADGSIGMQLAARAPADGYNFVFGATATVSINPSTFKSLPYDPEKDFTGVALIGTSPFILVVNPDVKAHSIRELLALAKAEPTKVAFTSPGQRSLPGMIGEILKLRSGVDILHVPISGAQGLQDTIAGRTQFTIQGIPAVAALIKQGQLRPLAVVSSERLPGMDNVPTLAETFPGFDYRGWFAIFAPAGTPDDVIRRMNQEIDRAIMQPSVFQRLEAMGIYPKAGVTPEQTTEFARRERALWRKTVTELGIPPR